MLNHMTTALTLDVELGGTLLQAKRARPRADGTYEPGAGAAIEGLRVYVGSGPSRIDITAALSADQLRALEEDGVELTSAL